MATAKKLPSGSWRVQVYAGTGEDGKRIYKSFTAETKRQAELDAALWMSDSKEREKSGQTVGEAIDRYIQTKQETLSPSTVLNYKAYLKNHYEAIKDLPVDALTIQDVQMFVSGEAAKYGGKTVANIFGLLSAALKMFRPDFAANVTLPRKKKTRVEIPSVQDVARYYDAVKGGKLEIPFLLATQCGLRASEIGAIRRDDIRDGMLIVSKARVRGDDGLMHEKAPKSDAGYRELPITEDLERILLASEGERVSQIDADQIPNRWAKLLRREGLPLCGFHALRHYFASRAALAGVPKMYLVELMGHSSSRMLDQVYLHTFPDEKAQFAAMMKGMSRSFFDNVQHKIQHDK